MAHFALDALDARKGDALVLRWGADDESLIALIDGGPSPVYEEAIQPHLNNVVGTDPAGMPKPVELELVIVSHVDDDHINGIIDLANAIDSAQKQASPLPATIGEVWHNAFSDMQFLDDFADEPDLQKAIKDADADPNALLEPSASPSDDPTFDDITAGAQSVAQGRQLDRILAAINVPRNTSFADRESFVREGPPVDVKRLSVSVLAPDTALLDKLKTEWRKELDKIRKKEIDTAKAGVSALAAAFDDKSIPNQSSIVLLVEFGKKTMLLTGDVRGDHLIKALKRNPDRVSPLEVDLFKIPHHGSSHSNSAELFEAVKASHYVISGNGEHGNPHGDTLKALFKTNDRPITVYLTNRPSVGAVKPEDVIEAKRAQKMLDAAAADPNITIRYRDEDALAITVDLI